MDSFHFPEAVVTDKGAHVGDVSGHLSDVLYLQTETSQMSNTDRVTFLLLMFRALDPLKEAGLEGVQH